MDVLARVSCVYKIKVGTIQTFDAVEWKVPAVMFFSKLIFTLLLLHLAHESVCKPTDDYAKQDRGYFSTIWDWVSYPFSWWGSSAPAPVSDHLIGSTTPGPNDIEVERHNVTIWCNDQTCTTMRCDQYGCKNTTCNIYDTDLKGQCRDYSPKPDEQAPTEPAETSSTPSTINTSLNPEEVTNAPQIESVVSNAPQPSQAVDEKPLQTTTLSTVTEAVQKPITIPGVVTNAPEIKPAFLAPPGRKVV